MDRAIQRRALMDARRRKLDELDREATNLFKRAENLRTYMRFQVKDSNTLARTLDEIKDLEAQAEAKHLEWDRIFMQGQMAEAEQAA